MTDPTDEEWLKLCKYAFSMLTDESKKAMVLPIIQYLFGDTGSVTVMLTKND